MRLLGVVANNTKFPALRELCIIDMIARSCKKLASLVFVEKYVNVPVIIRRMSVAGTG
jgi:hypothetical protein